MPSATSLAGFEFHPSARIPLSAASCDQPLTDRGPHLRIAELPDPPRVEEMDKADTPAHPDEHDNQAQHRLGPGRRVPKERDRRQQQQRAKEGRPISTHPPRQAYVSDEVIGTRRQRSELEANRRANKCNRLPPT